MEPASQPMRLQSRGYVGKRTLDIVAAGLGAVLFLPFFVLIWALVRVTSPGPGLYWSRRVGRGGRLFWMPKFRTMRVDAPEKPREAFAAADADAMITPIGRLLRNSSVDELPQLWCILVGDMSLIGPRPLLASDPGARARRSFPLSLTVKPGLSGLAQVNGRNAVTPRRKARLDALYANRLSFALDLRLMLRTAQIVFTRAGLL